MTNLILDSVLSTVFQNQQELFIYNNMILY